MQAIRITENTKPLILEADCVKGYHLEDMDWDTRIKQGAFFVTDPYSDWVIHPQQAFSEQYEIEDPRLYAYDERMEEWFEVSYSRNREYETLCWVWLEHSGGAIHSVTEEWAQKWAQADMYKNDMFFFAKLVSA